MANKKYKYEDSLPTCKVDRFLLESLEGYIIEKVPEFVKSAKKNLKDNFSISIYDKFGEEELKSIEEYTLRTFPDDTHKIQLRLYWSDYEKEESIRIWINFDKDSAKLTVEIDGKNPKEITTGIVSSIKLIIIQNRTSNKIFHLPIGISAISIGLGFLSFWISITLIDRSIKYSMFFFSITILITAHFLVLKKLKPYTSFDTIRQSKIDKNVN